MIFITFVLGIIVGILLNPAKKNFSEIIEKIKIEQENKGKTEFFEPVTDKEKFIKASNIDDTLK